MKISKNLLQTIAVGIAIGTTVSVTTSSCSFLEENAEVEPIENQDGKCTGKDGETYECGPCGMG